MKNLEELVKESAKETRLARLKLVEDVIDSLESKVKQAIREGSRVVTLDIRNHAPNLTLSAKQFIKKEIAKEIKAAKGFKVSCSPSLAIRLTW